MRLWQHENANEYKEDFREKFYDYCCCFCCCCEDRHSTYVTVLNNSPCTSTRANTSPSPEVWDPYNALCIHNNVCRSSFSRD